MEKLSQFVSHKMYTGFCFLDILTKPKGCITHSAVILTLRAPSSAIPTLMEAFNKSGEKKLWKFFQHFNSCTFFHGRLKACQIFSCVKLI